jgi:ketosteroid isomerase-like protein
MKMRSAHVRNVAVEFNNAITSRDLTRLRELMTEDHTLITGTEDPVNGKEACMDSWRQFFELLPDYRNVFERVWSVGQVVRMCGHSICTDERLNGPAIWMAVVEGTRIREWHVDEDTPEGLRRLGHDAGAD